MNPNFFHPLGLWALTAALCLSPAGARAAGGADRPATAAKRCAAAPWRGCDFSALFRMEGVIHSDKADTTAVFSDSFALPVARLVQVYASGREAQRLLDALRQGVDGDARYQPVSTIREEERYVHIYAHAGNGGYDEILIFGVAEEERTVIQLLGAFPTEALLKVVRHLGA